MECAAVVAAASEHILLARSMIPIPGVALMRWGSDEKARLSERHAGRKSGGVGSGSRRRALATSDALARLRVQIGHLWCITTPLEIVLVLGSSISAPRECYRFVVDGNPTRGDPSVESSLPVPRSCPASQKLCMHVAKRWSDDGYPKLPTTRMSVLVKVPNQGELSQRFPQGFRALPTGFSLDGLLSRRRVVQQTVIKMALGPRKTPNQETCTSDHECWLVAETRVEGIRGLGPFSL